jgi:O-methyltransferase
MLLKFVKTAYKRYLSRFRSNMRFPTYDAQIEGMISSSTDPVRYATIALALRRIDAEKINGDIAELGVWKGKLSVFLHKISSRDVYLFDTFEGFDKRDVANAHARDAARFRDTSLAQVSKLFDGSPRVHLIPGWFPDTAVAVLQNRFSMVMLDFDLYDPTKAALEFFYPRVNRGGYIFLHDFNSPESDGAISRAVRDFMYDKPERVIEIPDAWGSVMFRKV